MNQKQIKEDTLMDAMGYIQDQYIEEAGNITGPQQYFDPKRLLAMAAALAIFVFAAVLLPKMFYGAGQDNASGQAVGADKSIDNHYATESSVAYASGSKEEGAVEQGALQNSFDSYAGSASITGSDGSEAINDDGSETTGENRIEETTTAYSFSQETVEEAAGIVTLRGDGAGLTFTLPEGWQFSKPLSAEEAPEIQTAMLGGLLHSAGAPGLNASLGYYPAILGICGTGLSFSELSLADGTSLSKGVETYHDHVEAVGIYYSIINPSETAAEDMLMVYVSGMAKEAEVAVFERELLTLLNSLTVTGEQGE